MAMPDTVVLKFPSRAAQIRALSHRGFTARQIAEHCNCDTSDVYSALHKEKHGDWNNKRHFYSVQKLGARIDEIEQVIFEIRRQVRKLNGEPDDPCERRLAGLPV